MKNIVLFIIQIVLTLFAVVLSVFSFIVFPGGLFRLIFVMSAILIGLSFLRFERNLKILLVSVGTVSMTIGIVIIVLGIGALRMFT